MARMGHDSERAAMIYQHEARSADQAITNVIDAQVQAEQGKDGEGPAEATAGEWHANATEDQQRLSGTREQQAETGSDLGIHYLERVTGIEPALSAWESVRFGLLCGLTCGAGCPRVTATDPFLPGLMAR
jgi:hypothetical protein